MGKEKPESVVEEIRKALKEGASKGGGAGIPDEILFVPKDGVKTVRFLSEFNEPVKVEQHDKYGTMMPQPCLKYYGKKCPFDDAEGYRTSVAYVYTVFDYESGSKRLLAVRATLNSPLEDLVEIWDKNSTIKDRDIKILRVVLQGKSKYKAREVQPKPTKYEGKLKNAFPEDKVFAIMKGLIRKVKVDEPEAEEAEEDEE